MADPDGALGRFFAILRNMLVADAAGRSDLAAAAMIADFARSLASVPPAAAADDGRNGRPFALPVCRFWEGALAAAGEGGMAGLADLAACLRRIGPVLRWTQNPNYRRHPPDSRFLENYGYAVIAGPAADGGPGGARPLVPVDELAVGILLVGPGTHYPPHRHSATEIYGVVAGRAEWRQGEAPWRPESPGTLILHAPNVPHATRTGAEPLLAVYLWRGDLATHARLIGLD